MSPVNKDVHRTYFYRMVDGEKVLWYYDINRERVLVAEGKADPDQMLSVSIRTKRSKRANPEHLKKQLGEDYKGPPVELIDQFLDSTKECPDRPGWEEARKAYMEDLTLLGGEENCPSCQLGTLRQKYFRKLYKIDTGEEWAPITRKKI